MILGDANLPIYAGDRDSPHHAPVRWGLETALSGSDWVGLPWISVLACLRITTHPAVMRKPLAGDAAVACADGWVRQPFLRLVGPGEKHWPVLRSLLKASGTAANLTSEAHLAALAIEHGTVIASADNDFRRFAGVRLVNPPQAA